MNAAQSKAKSLFLNVVELRTPAQRQAYLDAECGGDAVLRREVEDLLRHFGQVGSFLQSVPADPALTVDEAPIQETPGTIIGSYKLLEQIGEGGFGVVFMAEQQEPIRRKVALKILKPGMDTRQVVARFEAERQALAIMDHPNIARVFDGGATASGRPYFVMELVKGVPITDFCDQTQMPIRQRLELFVSVCQAVQHAHQKGIIHRDLKPSNVLVTLHDGTPVVKVIDFGIAKATGQQLTDKTLFTNFAQMIGTPLYMSPEQSGMSGLDVDTRSDIYSLGVLLYELLTGTTPFDKERLKSAGYDEMRRIIREEEPPRPSTRISTLGQAVSTVSSQRKSDPKQLSRLCRGEPDWIVMKALEKDRNRRYETASAFAADVQRYLNDESVQACPPSVWYRFRKFVRRNKRVLTTVVTAAASLLVGLSATVVLLAKHAAEIKAEHEQTRKEYDRAETALGQAKGNLERADRNLALALEALDGVYMQDVEDRILRDRRVTEAERGSLQKGLQFYDRFAQQNHGHAGLERATAKAYRRAGYLRLDLKDWTEAQADFAKAIAAFEKWADESHGSVDDRVELARSCYGMTVGLRRAGRHREAAPICRRAIALWQMLSADDRVPNHRVELGHCFWQVAEGMASVQQPEKAEAALRQALRLFEGLVAEYPKEPFYRQEVGYSRRGLGDLLRTTGRKREATESYEKAVLAYGSVVTEAPANAFCHQELGLSYIRLGGSLRESRQPQEPEEAYNQKATAAFREGLSHYSKAIELNPKNAAAWCLRGTAYGELHQYDKAIADLNNAIKLDPKDAFAHNNLGFVLAKQGQLDEAIACFKKAVELKPKLFAPHHNLGLALYQRGELDEAIAEYVKAIELDPKCVDPHNRLGDALRQQGRRDKYTARIKNATELSPKCAPAHGNLGLCYWMPIEFEPKSALVHYNLGLALRAQGRLDEAAAAYRKAIAVKPEYAEAHCNLGQILLQQGEFRQALEELRRGHQLGCKHPVWPYPSAHWVRQYEHLVELDGKLPGFLKGKAAPASTDERIEVAGLCCLKHRNSAAARFYEEAFAAEPKRADDLGGAHRYNAACAAALAGCGQGQDAAGLDAKERALLRRQARDWLRTDLAAWGRLEKESDKSAPVLTKTMQRWLVDPDFAGVRGPEALAKLPEAERQLWQELWHDVTDMLSRTQGNTRSEKKSDAK